MLRPSLQEVEGRRGERGEDRRGKRDKKGREWTREEGMGEQGRERKRGGARTEINGYYTLIYPVSCIIKAV